MLLGFVLAVPLTHAGELPPELAGLKARYEQRIGEIDQEYRAGLEKVREKYRLAENYTGATAVSLILDNLGKQEGAQDEADNALCSILVRSGDKLVIGELKVGSKRIYGDYEPKFERVDSRLVGADYTQGREKKKVEYQITCVTSGYLYLYGGDDLHSKDADAEQEPLRGILASPYLDSHRFSRVLLVAGKSYVCGGFECNLIARQITTR